MCNLYNVSTNQEAIRALTRTFRDITGNLPPSLDVYPDYPAPVVRTGEDGKRELANLRWGMPSPPQYAGLPITTCATQHPRTGGAGWARRTSSWCLRRHSASGKILSRRKPSAGLRSMRIVPCFSSRGSGPNGTASARRPKGRWIIRYSGF